MRTLHPAKIQNAETMDKSTKCIKACLSNIGIFIIFFKDSLQYVRMIPF